jgi:putative phosphoribosyl transferase
MWSFDVDMRFRDRRQAGDLLGRALAQRRWESPVVLALPRGGVPVAVPVARALNAPLDLLLVRKIGAPGNPELAVAAVCDGGTPTVEVDTFTMSHSGASTEYIWREVPKQIEEIERRRRLYLGNRPPLELRAKTAIVVDDGIATGTTLRAALRSLRPQEPARIVVAVPVAPAHEVDRLRAEVDEVVCLHAPRLLEAVGCHYEHFEQVSDDEVIALLRPSGD